MKDSLLLGQVDGSVLQLPDGMEVQVRMGLLGMGMDGVLDLGRVVVLGLVGSGRSGGELRLVQRALGVVCLPLLLSFSPFTNLSVLQAGQTTPGHLPPHGLAGLLALLRLLPPLLRLSLRLIVREVRSPV